MARILLPLFFLAALIGLGILLVFGNGDDIDIDSTPDQGELESEQTLDTESALAGVELEPSPVNTIERTDVEPEKSTEPAYQAPLARGGILVSVVEGESDTPVPHADVMVLDSGLVDMDEMRRYMTSAMDLEMVLRHYGKTYQANENGKVRIPEAVGFLAVGGVTETLFDFDGNIDVVDGAFTLRLKPIDLITVQVIDQFRAPVEGAQVTIRHHDNNRSMNTVGGVTNEEGLASLKVFEGLKHDLGRRGTTSVALIMLTPTQIEEPIDLKALPDSPVVLVMPASGKVRVNLLDAKGNIAKGEFLVQLSIFDPATDSDEIQPLSEWGFEAENNLGSIMDGSGTTTFDFVALGLEVRMKASSRDQTKLAMADGTGPVSAGETVSFTLVPKVLSPVIAATVFGPDGAVLADQTIRVFFDTRAPGRSHYQSQTVDTDSNGRFQVPFEGVHRMDDDYDCTIKTMAEHDGNTWSALAPLPSPLVVGLMQIGEIHLEPTPTLAQGRVVDELGNPVEDAQVMLERDIHAELADASPLWESITSFYDRSDADGFFHIKGIASPGRYRVATTHREFGGRNMEIPLGSEDLEILLKGNVMVKGRILMDDWLKPSDLEVELRTTNDYGGSSTRWVSLGEDGSFRLDPDRDSTGLATVTVQLDHGSISLFSLEDLDLSAPETQQLLETIDLRGLLHRITLTVRDESGGFLKWVQVKSGSSSAGAGEGEFLQVVSLEPSMDLDIYAEGYGVVHLSNASGHHDVVLPAGYTIAITLDNPSVLAEGWIIQGQLAFATIPDDPNANKHYSILDSDVAMDGSPIIVSRHGPYVVLFTVEEAMPDGRKVWGIPGDSPEFTVQNVNGRQDFHIAIPTEAFDYLGSLNDKD